MSLATRLSALITAIGADIKAINTLIDTIQQNVMIPTAADCGFLIHNQDIHGLNTNSSVTAGTLYMMKLTNRKATSITVSSVTVFCGTAGVSLTNVGFALYSSAKALLTSSVNTNGATATAFQSANPRTVTFTTPQVIAAGASFYVGFWFTGTTMPQLMRSSGTNFVINVGTTATNYRYATADTGLTTTAPATATTLAMAPFAYYVAAA